MVGQVPTLLANPGSQIARPVTSSTIGSIRIQILVGARDMNPRPWPHGPELSRSGVRLCALASAKSLMNSNGDGPMSWRALQDPPVCGNA